MRADAPSLIVEALAAVTVPSFEKAGRSVGIFSNITFLYSSSSVIIKFPLRDATSTGIISSLNCPPSVVAAEFL